MVLAVPFWHPPLHRQPPTGSSKPLSLTNVHLHDQLLYVTTSHGVLVYDSNSGERSAGVLAKLRTMEVQWTNALWVHGEWVYIAYHPTDRVQALGCALNPHLQRVGHTTP